MLVGAVVRSVGAQQWMSFVTDFRLAWGLPPRAYSSNVSLLVFFEQRHRRTWKVWRVHCRAQGDHCGVSDALTRIVERVDQYRKGRRGSEATKCVNGGLADDGILGPSHSHRRLHKSRPLCRWICQYVCTDVGKTPESPKDVLICDDN